MNLSNIQNQLSIFQENNQIFEAAHFLIESFGLENENFAGFGFRAAD